MILQAIDYNSENFGKDFAESLKETGFGVIKNHPISKDKVQTIYQNWANFFNTDEKNNFILVCRNIILGDFLIFNFGQLFSFQFFNFHLS